MLSSLKIFIIVSFCSFGFILKTYAQKQKILVVPYTRFQLVSEYKLSDIAQINRVTESEVFDQYTLSLKHAFQSYNSDLFEFEILNTQDYLTIKKLVKYEIQKFNGRKYNASNLRLVNDSLFSSMLTKNNAEYIVFVNWYVIQKNVHISYVGDSNKRHPFAAHKLDFDVYNKKKQRILGQANAKIFCGEFPSQELIEEKCLKAPSLVPCYQQLITDLLGQIALIK